MLEKDQRKEPIIATVLSLLQPELTLGIKAWKDVTNNGSAGSGETCWMRGLNLFEPFPVLQRSRTRRPFFKRDGTPALCFTRFHFEIVEFSFLLPRTSYSFRITG